MSINMPDGGNFASGSVCWNALNAAARHNGPAPHILDLSEQVHLKPYSIACLVALDIKCGADRPTVVPPDDDECRAHLERIGFFDWFGGHEPEEREPRDTNVRVRQITANPLTFSDEAMTIWAAEIGGIHNGTRPTLCNSIDEVIMNAIQHAESPIGCVVAGQAFPRTGKVEVCVADFGMTIRGHLGQRMLAPTDAAYIQLATEEGITGATGTLNSGAGLYDLRTFIELGGGTMTILSGAHWVVFGPDRQPIVREFRGGFPGTLVNVQFDTTVGLTQAEVDPIL